MNLIEKIQNIKPIRKCAFSNIQNIQQDLSIKIPYLIDKINCTK